MKKCKMCGNMYADSMGFCPECGAIEFESVSAPVERKPEPVERKPEPIQPQPAQKTPANGYTWGDPRSTETYNAEKKAFEAMPVSEKKSEPAAAPRPAQNTPSNANNPGCLGSLLKWIVYFFAFFVVVYIITEIL